MRKIDYIFPSMDRAERAELLKKHFAHQITSFEEILAVLKRKSRLKTTVERWPVEAFDAVNRGEGVLCVSAHFGNPYLLPAIFPYASQEAAYFRRTPNRELNPVVRWFQRCRDENARKYGFNPIESSRRGLRRALRLLSTGNFVIALGDLVWEDRGVVVKLFGRDWRFSRAPGVLAKRSGANVLFVVTRRQVDGSLRVDIGDIMKIPRPYSTTEAGECIARSFASFLEPHIADAPEQWLWSHEDLPLAS